MSYGASGPTCSPCLDFVGGTVHKVPMTDYGSKTVAIDGPAGAGKSTVSKAVAKALGYTLVDTGAIYRSVALMAQRQDVDWDDEEGLAGVVGQLDISFSFDEDVNRVFVAGEEVTSAIRVHLISTGASRVSSHPRVRAGLLELQRRLAGQGGAVLEGRDIGTVVCPDAEVKVFLDASAEERARRRQSELRSRGEQAEFDTILRDIEERDRRDRERATAPLKAAEDAHVLDSTKLTVDEVIEAIVALV